MIKCNYNGTFIPCFVIEKEYIDINNRKSNFTMFLDEVEARQLRDFLNEKFDCEEEQNEN